MNSDLKNVFGNRELPYVKFYVNTAVNMTLVERYSGRLRNGCVFARAVAWR